MKTEPKTISAEEFDRLFDEGSDQIDQYIDWNSWRRASDAPTASGAAVNLPVEAVNLPQELVRRIDQAAQRAHVSRENLLERLIIEGLDAAA